MFLRRGRLAAFLLVAVSLATSAPRSEAAMIHRYSFTTDGSDPVGGADAILRNGATVSLGKLMLDGIDDYAELPIGSTIQTLENFTIEAWVTRDQAGQWARICDFGTNTSDFMFLSSQSNFGLPVFFIRNGATQSLQAEEAFPIGTKTHIAVSVDHSGKFAALYVNGFLAASATGITLRGSDLGSTTLNYLGRSLFVQDPYFKGSIDELRIYDGALPPWEVLRSYQRGPDSDQPESMPDVVVPATANLFRAGHATLPSPLAGGSGTRPVLIDLAAGCDSVVTFTSVAGKAKPGFSPTWGWNTPDGQVNSGTAIDSLLGIAGILHSRQMFLAGLFLDDSEPQAPAPARLDFRPTPTGIGDQFIDLYPGLRQIFFIGDGVTDAANLQSFHVPNGATRLYLGFADANGFHGSPGYYDDDFGSMSARVSLCGQPVTSVPRSGPAEFELLGAHPNPLTGTTEITFTLSRPQSVAVRIFDVSGRLVRRLTDGVLPAGQHSALWNRRDDHGRQVASGIYFYSLNAQGQRRSSWVVVE